MTCREKFLQDNPDCTEADVDCACPWVCGYDKNHHCPSYENDAVMECEDCWNREIDETVCPQELPMVGTWTWKEESIKHWILVDGTTGVCPNCHRQDHIDPLAKYCRYCGTRLEVQE